MIFLPALRQKLKDNTLISVEIISVLCVIIFRWWLGKNQILISNGGSIYDDQLFVDYANSLLHGHWLGSYNEFTLLKDIFYSCWIAIMYWLHIPLLWSQQLVYIFACTVMYFSIRLRYKGLFPFITYCIVLFNPITYQISERVIRYHIYISLSLILVSSLLIHNYLKQIASSYYALFTCILGIIIGVYYITREEFFWIVPVLVCSFVCTALQVQDCKTKMKRRKRYLVIFLKNALPFFIGTAVVVVGVIVMNYRTYGVAIVNEIKQSPFILVYGDLLRINHKTNIRYVSIPNEVIDVASSVSTNFSRLQTVLKGPEVQWARTQTEGYVGLGTNEIGNNEFVFVLRQAASQLGYFADAKKSFNFFRTIHHDISLACAKGTISCYPLNLRVFPPLKVSDVPLIIESFFHSISTLFCYYDIDVLIFPSIGSQEDMVYIQSMTHSVRMSVLSSATSWLDYTSGRYKSDIPQAKTIQIMLDIYSTITAWIVIIGLVSYILLVIQAMMSHTVNFQLTFLTGLFISMFLLILFISYLAAIQSPLPKMTYMAPVSPLLSLFSCLSIHEVLVLAYRRFKNRRK